MLSRFASILILSPALFGQSYVTMPAGYLTIEAPGYSIYFGARPSMRCQFFNAEYSGSAKTFKEVSCRRDGARDASPYHFAGRSWKDVRLTMAEGSYANASSTFSSNLQNRVSQVFSGSVTWPDHSSGGPTSQPHTWANDVRFPFNTPWTYSGGKDVTLDFQFSGGTLANQQYWTTYRPYYVDGVHVTTRAGGSSTNFGTNNCVNAPYTNAPFCVPMMHTYAKNTGNPGTANKYHFQWWLGRYPANAPTVVALSLFGNLSGLNINNPCQNYFVGAGIALFGRTPNDNSKAFFLPSSPFTENYVSTAVGIKIWTQAAFQHPTRNRLELTRGGFTTIMAQPTPPSGAAWMFATFAASPVGGRISSEYLPLLRLQR
jgi:hypothetical protein